MGLLYLIRHPHTQIDRTIPAHDWNLSDQGRQQVGDLLEAPCWPHIHTIYPSRELKSITAAKEVALRYQIPIIPRSALGEVDRSDFVAPDQESYRANVAAFFAHPDQSAQAAETATAAFQRFHREMIQILSWHEADQNVAIIAHGLILTVVTADLLHKPPTMEDWLSIGFATIAAVDRATMQPISAFIRAPYEGLPLPQPEE